VTRKNAWNVSTSILSRIPKMKIGDLVHSIHDHTHRGIVMEVSVSEEKVVRVKWFDGDETLEYGRMLDHVEVLSESR
tara:strand:- start:4364 stop:4594 length:231 start_codon:yes stop_codon:yes gene_type:complete